MKGGYCYGDITIRKWGEVINNTNVIVYNAQSYD